MFVIIRLCGKKIDFIIRKIEDKYIKRRMLSSLKKYIHIPKLGGIIVGSNYIRPIEK